MADNQPTAQQAHDYADTLANVIAMILDDLADLPGFESHKEFYKTVSKNIQRRLDINVQNIRTRRL